MMISLLRNVGFIFMG